MAPELKLTAEADRETNMGYMHQKLAPAAQWLQEVRQDFGRPGLSTLVLSGIINGLLMFVFCCVFAILVFQDKRDDSTVLKDFLPVGVSMHIFSVMMGSIFYACFTSCKASIAGPDINPALFFALIVESIQLGADSQSPTPVEAILPTSLLAICIGTIVIGVTFLTLGHFKLTRIVQYLPASLLNGFLACIGYKVMKAALTTTCGDIYYKKPGKFIFWKLMLPALPVGFGLYLAKAYHIGQPGVTFPVILLVPLGLFYAALVISGTSLEQARDQCLDVESSASCAGGWFYPEFGRGEFGAVYSTLNLAHVDVGALLYSFSDLPAMLLIVVIDYLLKLAGTKKAAGFDFPFDNEMKTAGMACLASAVGGFSPPAYSQTKFTVLNIGITHNPESRVPGIVTGLFNAVLYFWGFPLINYLPRFFLGGLLIYAGLGFVVDNLIKSWNRVSREEFIAIWTIVIVNAVTSLLVAVVVGIILSDIIFAIAYGRISVVKAFIPGEAYESHVVRNILDSDKIAHVAQRYAIVQMQNYIFFGSAGQILDFVKVIFRAEQSKRHVLRLQYLIFDWTHVYGIDYSGLGVFLDIINMVKKKNVNIVFTGVDAPILNSMLRENLVQHVAGIYSSLDQGAEWIEEQLLEWAHLVRSRWLEFRPVIKMHERAKNKAIYDVFGQIVNKHDYGRIIGDATTRRVLSKDEVLCEIDDVATDMYIVQQGKLASYKRDGAGELVRVGSYARGAYINEMAIFSSAKLQHRVVAEGPSGTIVLQLSADTCRRLEAERPDVLAELQRTILRYYRQHGIKAERKDQIHNARQNLKQLMAFHAKGLHAQGATVLNVLPRGLQSEVSEEDIDASNENGEVSMGNNGSIESNESIPTLNGLQGKPGESQRGDEQRRSVRNSDWDAITKKANLRKVSPYLESPSDGALVLSSDNSLEASFRALSGTTLRTTITGPAPGEVSRHMEALTTGVALVHAALKLTDEQTSTPLRNVLRHWTEDRTFSDVGHSRETQYLFGSNTVAQLANTSDAAPIRTFNQSLQLSSTGMLCLSPERIKASMDCFRAQDTRGAQRLDTKQVLDALQKLGHHINERDLAILLALDAHGDSHVADESNHGLLKSRTSILTLLRDHSAHTSTRHVDSAEIKLESQIELMSTMLRSTAFFPVLESSNEGFTSATAERSEILIFRREETLCMEGNPVNSMFIILDGVLSVTQGDTTRTVHVSHSPFVIGADTILHPGTIPQHAISVSVVSQRSIAIEILRITLLDLVPGTDSTLRTEQKKAVRLAEMQRETARKAKPSSGSVRRIESVLAQQQKATFGERYRALASVDLFKPVAELDPSLLSRLASGSEVIVFHEGQSIYLRGATANAIFVVISGTARIQQASKSEENPRTLAELSVSNGKMERAFVLGQAEFSNGTTSYEDDAICASETMVALKLSRGSLRNSFEETHPIWEVFQDNAQRGNNRASRARMAQKLGNFRQKTLRMIRSPSTRRPSDDLTHQGSDMFASAKESKSKRKVNEKELRRTMSSPNVAEAVSPQSPLSPQQKEKDNVTSASISQDVRGNLDLDLSNNNSNKDKDNDIDHDNNSNDTSKDDDNNSKNEDKVEQTVPMTQRVHRGTEVELFQFLNLVTRLSLYPLSSGQVSALSKLFKMYASSLLSRNKRSSPGNTDILDIEAGQDGNEKHGEAICVITRKKIRKLFEDAELQVLCHNIDVVLQEWASEDADVPALTLQSFVSVIALDVQNEQTLLEVESVYKTILGFHDQRDGAVAAFVDSWTPETGHGMSISEKWELVTNTFNLGITSRDIQECWKRFIDAEISFEAAEEMVFEADLGGAGYITFQEFVDAVECVHPIELTSSMADIVMLQRQIKQANSPTAGLTRMFRGSNRRSSSVSRALLATAGPLYKRTNSSLGHK